MCIKVKVNYRKATGFWPLSKNDPAIELWKTEWLGENLEKFKKKKEKKNSQSISSFTVLEV